MPTANANGQKLIRPIYKQWSDELDMWTWGVTQEDADYIADGWACTRCLECFHIGGLPAQLDICPVCRMDQRLMPDYRVVPTPDGW